MALISLYMASRINQAYLYMPGYSSMPLWGLYSFLDMFHLLMAALCVLLGVLRLSFLIFVIGTFSPYYPNFYCPNVPGNGSRVMTPFLLSLALHPAYQGCSRTLTGFQVSIKYQNIAGYLILMYEA